MMRILRIIFATGILLSLISCFGMTRSKIGRSMTYVEEDDSNTITVFYEPGSSERNRSIPNREWKEYAVKSDVDYVVWVNKSYMDSIRSYFTYVVCMDDSVKTDAVIYVCADSVEFCINRCGVVSSMNSNKICIPSMAIYMLKMKSGYYRTYDDMEILLERDSLVRKYGFPLDFEKTIVSPNGSTIEDNEIPSAEPQKESYKVLIKASP